MPGVIGSAYALMCSSFIFISANCNQGESARIVYEFW